MLKVLTGLQKKKKKKWQYLLFLTVVLLVQTEGGAMQIRFKLAPKGQNPQRSLAGSKLSQQTIGITHNHSSHW